MSRKLFQYVAFNSLYIPIAFIYQQSRQIFPIIFVKYIPLTIFPYINISSQYIPLIFAEMMNFFDEKLKKWRRLSLLLNSKHRLLKFYSIIRIFNIFDETYWLISIPLFEWFWNTWYWKKCEPSFSDFFNNFWYIFYSSSRFQGLLYSFYWPMKHLIFSSNSTIQQWVIAFQSLLHFPVHSSKPIRFISKMDSTLVILYISVVAAVVAYSISMFLRLRNFNRVK